MVEEQTEDPELLAKLRHRNGIAFIPIIVIGFVSIVSFAVPRFFGWDIREVRSLLGLAYFITWGLTQRILTNLDRRAGDPDASSRLNSLIAGTQFVSVEVHVDDGLRGLSQPFWLRDRDRVIVSRRLLQNFTPEEVDFALVSAVCRHRVFQSPVDLRYLIGAICLLVLTFAPHQSLPPLLPLLSFIGGMALLITSITVQKGANTKSDLSQDIAADEAALAITRNNDAAESAMSKMVGEKPDAAGEKRLRNIRNIPYRTSTSTLPPRGWSPG